jgi:hypothetical protein
VALATLKRETAKLLAELRRQTAPAASTLFAELRTDPSRIMSLAGKTPDPWQAALLRSTSRRMLLCCARQSGKSALSAALALKAALLEPPALILILARAQRQAAELFADKLLPLYRALGSPVPPVREPGALGMTLTNGSRIIALPGKEQTIRSYSGVRPLIIDEASRVPDALYYSVRPMLAVSQGRLVALSTPWGRQGWFFEAWHGKGNWERVKITATECLRIPPEFLEEERLSLGEHWFAQEYLVEFREAIDSFFRQEDIDRAFAPGVAAWDLGI